MGRTRARLVAVGIVISSMVGSALALEIWPNAQPPQSNPAVPVSANGRVVFSIRNTDTTSLQINSFTFNASDPVCAALNAPKPLGGGMLPLTIAAGAQAQFMVDIASPYFASPGDESCDYLIDSIPTTPANQPVAVTFHVLAASTFDIQPTAMSFGDQSPGNFETQTLVVTGYGSAQSVTVTIDNDAGQNFELVGCGTTTSCMISDPGGGGSNTVQIRCTGSNAGTVTAIASVHATTGGIGPFTDPQIGSVGTDTVVGQTQLVCNGVAQGGSIFLSPDPLNIIADEGALGSATITATGSGSASAASITGYPQFAISGCGQSCSSGFGLPGSLSIECTPTSMQTQATLTVDHALGSSATATIYCTPNATPKLFVSPTSLSFGSLDVGAMGSQSLHIENQGGGTLTGVAISFLGANAGNYYADACTTAAPCSLGSGSAGFVDVPIWFAPTVHGQLLSSLEVVANEDPSTAQVGLDGTGLGGVMVVTAPSSSTTPPFHLDFGTIPKNQSANAVITLRNDGNKLYTAVLDGVAAPYAATSTTLPIAESTSDDFHLSCGSDTPSASNEQTWTISSDAYMGSPQSVSVSCAIADTSVTVNPLMFDFGEVRVGTTAPEMSVTVGNPATNAGPAQIKRMELHAARSGLSLAPPMTMQSLGVGQELMATLHLDTSADTDLTGEQLDIDVDNANLALPVRGKVVTPHSHVVPDHLDLGTACMGTQVSGNVMLINDGTATLNVERPQMSESFVAATPGSLYPVALPSGMSLQASVSPAISATGRIEGTLTWSDDVPSAYEVPVTLEYVESGTALSPRALDYGVVAVDAPATTQRLLLENCDPEPATVSVKSLTGKQGPIGAWVLSPRVGYSKMLGAHDQQAVDVTFKPPARGHYEAELVVATKSGVQKVVLVGEATGHDFDHTSFYTCSCTTPGAPWGGWPLPAAMFVLIVRRRRGSSSLR